MKRLTFQIEINCKADKIYDTMLGLSSKASYEQWTTFFNPTSTYEGSWEKGSKMKFIGIDSSGNKGGMVSVIAENDKAKFVSIKHIGLVKGNEEITEGPEVEAWAGGLENYRYEQIGDKTKVEVQVDIVPEFEDYMQNTYPEALKKLKEICE